MTHLDRIGARMWCLAAALALAAVPAAAQNGYSFLDAEKSAIDYRATPVTAQRACHELRQFAGGQVTIIKAEAVEWSAQAPAHCRVVGVIAPEIQLDATDPDLSAFKSRGGKILMYFGWADTALTPYMGIDYYEKVTARLGATTKDFMRLFMVPGMFHCRGGIGVDRIDALTPLINWVEGGQAPAQMAAARMESGKIVRTRPLCPYPQAARYTGSGSLDDAANFACRDP